MSSATVAAYKTGTYAVTRGAAGSYVTGLWVPGATSVLNLDCAVQPLRGRDLQNLPEGKHASDLRKIYCETTLRTVDETAGTPADRISIDGDTYEVITAESWASGHTGESYCKAIAARVVGS